jgi:hypothetical protein
MEMTTTKTEECELCKTTYTVGVANDADRWRDLTGSLSDFYTQHCYDCGRAWTLSEIRDFCEWQDWTEEQIITAEKASRFATWTKFTEGCEDTKREGNRS